MTAEIETGIVTEVTNEIGTEMIAAVTATRTIEVTETRAAVTGTVMIAVVVAMMVRSHNLNVTMKMIIMKVIKEVGIEKNRRGGTMIMMMTATSHPKRSPGGMSQAMMMTTTGQARKRTGINLGLGHGRLEERIGQGPGVVNVTDPKKETKIWAVTEIIEVQKVLEVPREMLEWTIWKRESWMEMEAQGVQITEVGAAA